MDLNQLKQISLLTKGGTNTVLEFGAEAPAGFQYASVKLDGEWWIFEIPWPLYRDVRTYLSPPTGSP